MQNQIYSHILRDSWKNPVLLLRDKDFKTLTFTVKSITCTSTMLFLSGLESAQSFSAMAGEEVPQLVSCKRVCPMVNGKIINGLASLNRFSGLLTAQSALQHLSDSPIHTLIAWCQLLIGSNLEFSILFKATLTCSSQWFEPPPPQKTWHRHWLPFTVANNAKCVLYTVLRWISLQVWFLIQQG